MSRTATHSSVSAEDELVKVEILVPRNTTYRFLLTSSAASALASDLSQIAGFLHDRLSAPGAETTETIYAPVATIAESGELETGELFLALQTRDGIVHRYRLQQNEVLNFARSIVDGAATPPSIRH